MERSKLLAIRLREVLLDGLWIANTNFKSQLQLLSWVQATQKIGTLNTIAELTYHVNYYLKGLLNVLRGGELEISDKYSFDMSLIESETDWRSLVDEFLKHSEEFVFEVAKIHDHQLDEAFVDKKYGTYLRNIEGVIEHSYYHLGQVSLLRKMILEMDP